MRILRLTLFALAAAGLAIMVGALFLQVLAREFRWAVDWTEELGRFAFIAMVFIAAAYGTLTRSHLRVSVFSDLLAKVVGARAIHFLHTIVLIGFAGVMVVFSWLNFTDGMRYPNISPAIGFNQNHLFLAMCAGFAIILVLHLRDLVILLRGGSLDE
jgi:TRAP-type C4-dicarboxylate transport system permease small subunit